MIKKEAAGLYIQRLLFHQLPNLPIKEYVPYSIDPESRQELFLNLFSGNSVWRIYAVLKKMRWMCSIRFNILIDDGELVSAEFRRDAKILDLRADSVIKKSFITAVDCEISQSTKIW